MNNFSWHIQLQVCGVKHLFLTYEAPQSKCRRWVTLLYSCAIKIMV